MRIDRLRASQVAGALTRAACLGVAWTLLGLGCQGPAEASAGGALVQQARAQQNPSPTPPQGQPSAQGDAAEQERAAGAIQCLERAKDVTFLGEGNAFLLCRGARSAGPVDCYQAADERTFLSRRLSFELCRCAVSTGPVSCFERAQRDTFLDDREIVALCSAIASRNLALNCVPLGHGAQEP